MHSARSSEIISEGTDITVVTYGACIDIAKEAITGLKAGISAELLDVRLCCHFDINSVILQSLKKTNRILFLDEDVPGSATAYMMQQVLDRDGGYKYLDSIRNVCQKPNLWNLHTERTVIIFPNQMRRIFLTKFIQL